MKENKPVNLKSYADPEPEQLPAVISKADFNGSHE